ncbi:MAG: hypothetical protein V4611_02365 [Patescibacteria group bacterium]
MHIEREIQSNSSVEHTPYFKGDLKEMLTVLENTPRGEPSTFGATPLDVMATLQQQRDLLIDLQRMTYAIPTGVPLVIADYVHETFRSRFFNRGIANDENYTSALLNKMHYIDKPQLQLRIERAEHGLASPGELLLIRDLLGIRSVELACLSHPYGTTIDGTRIEDALPEMRNAVRVGVELMGGSYFDEPKTEYRVKASVGDSHNEFTHSDGLLMTRKRILAKMPDGTIIKERSSFVLRIDADSPVTKEEFQAMRALDAKSRDWQEDMVRAGGLDEIASVLLEMDEHSYAIPVSSTIYAFNPETTKKINQRDEALNAKHFEEDGRANPAYRPYDRTHFTPTNLESTTYVEEVNGMIFINSKEADTTEEI